ncbi:MAG: tRNA pseudouridine(38-40) synthase TruA [Bacteroidetes bacterium]|nr:tRNA pseudouridine(38-40) synthase TruA [Bacteroidota bacterium]
MNYRYFIKLAFDGTNYHGWQIQENAHTVQQVVNEALSMMLRETVSATGCGRTDSGVHAKEFFAHFEIDQEISVKACKDLVFRLNNYLDVDLVIYNIFHVKPRIHARFSAQARTYQYVITRIKNPFISRYSHFHYGPVDLELMNKGAEFLLSESDFTSFSKVHTETKTNICRVTYAKWEEDGDNLVFTIRADRFLRNMVRAIVGTLLDLGMKKITFDDFRTIIASKNRCDAGESVPAYGLFLIRVDYPDFN